MTLGIFFEAISYAMAPENYTYSFNLIQFIPLLLIAFLLLPIQTSCEEFMFRGYLMQMFAFGKMSKLIPIFFTSLLFAAIHLMNPEVAEYGLGIMFPYYISAGLILAIMTVMDDSIELALGVHAATNIYGAIFLSYEGAAIQTATLFKSENMDPAIMLIIFLVMAAVFLFLASKKYNWSSFSKLIESTQRENEIV
jgi:membrane protease YdiL (CAAX protease family)